MHHIRASLLSRIASAYIGIEGGCERPRNRPVGTTYISAPNQSRWGVGGRRCRTLLRHFWRAVRRRRRPGRDEVSLLSLALSLALFPPWVCLWLQLRATNANDASLWSHDHRLVLVRNVGLRRAFGRLLWCRSWGVVTCGKVVDRAHLRVRILAAAARIAATRRRRVTGGEGGGGVRLRGLVRRCPAERQRRRRCRAI